MGTEGSERKLIREAQRGSREALAALYAAHWQRAHRAAYLVVHDAAAAEDIAQEAFLAAIDALDRFDRRRPFGPWLHRIVDQPGDRLGAARGAAAQAPATPRQSRRGSRRRRSDRRRADAPRSPNCPPEQRAVVVLRHLLEYTPGEIARMLELPRGTVNSRLRRGLDQLRDLIEVEG